MFHHHLGLFRGGVATERGIDVDSPTDASGRFSEFCGLHPTHDYFGVGFLMLNARMVILWSPPGQKTESFCREPSLRIVVLLYSSLQCLNSRLTLGFFRIVERKKELRRGTMEHQVRRRLAGDQISILLYIEHWSRCRNEALQVMIRESPHGTSTAIPKSGRKTYFSRV